MKTIVIQLLKSMVLSEDEYYGIWHFGDSMEDYAPVGIYDYYKLGKKKTTGMRYKNLNLVTRAQKWMGSVGCFGQIENIKRQSLD